MKNTRISRLRATILVTVVKFRAFYGSSRTDSKLLLSFTGQNPMKFDQNNEKIKVLWLRKQEITEFSALFGLLWASSHFGGLGQPKTQKIQAFLETAFLIECLY